MDVYEAAEVFDALSQGTRLRVLELLVETGTRGMAAGAISRALSVPQNTLSFHLSHLERSRLIVSRRSSLVCNESIELNSDNTAQSFDSKSRQR